MKNKIVITDLPYKSGKADSISHVVYWNRVIKKRKNEIDILEFIERNAKKFKSEYIDFINKIKKNIINLSSPKKTIDKYLSVKEFDSINYTDVIEKCNWGKSFYINEIIKCYAVNTLLKKLKPDFVEVILEKDNETSLILKKIFKNYKINYKFHSKNNLNLNLTKTYLFPVFIKTIVSYFLFLIKNYSFWNSRSLNWLKFNADYLFVSYINNNDLKNIKNNISWDTYWGNISSTIEKRKKIRWVYFATTPKKLIDKINLSKIIFSKNKKNSNEKHINIYDFLTLNLFFKTFVIWLKILFRVNKINNVENLFYDQKNKIDLSFFLKKNFNKSYYSLEMLNNILIHLIFQEMSKKLKKQKKCFYLHEGAPWEYSLIKNFKKNKHGTLYGVGHSTISYWDLRFFKTIKRDKSFHTNYFNPDFFIANGEDMRKKILDFTNKKNVILAESLRYKYLVDFKKNRKSKKKSKLLNVLVILDLVREISLKQIQCIERLMQECKNINVTIKVHPTNDITQLLKKYLKNKCTTISLENLLKDTDIALTSNITSANVETVFLNIPTYCYIDPTSLNLCPILNKKNIYFYSYYSQLKKKLEEKKFNKKKILKKNFLLLKGSNDKWKKILKKY
jgi:surface carbohydrate biosynthesis protein (TIGR04326 family)